MIIVCSYVVSVWRKRPANLKEGNFQNLSAYLGLCMIQLMCCRYKEMNSIARNVVNSRALVQFCSHGEPDLRLWSISTIAAGSAMYCTCLRRHHCAAPPSGSNPCPEPWKPTQADAGGYAEIAPWPLLPPSNQRVWPLLEWLCDTHLCQAWTCKGSGFHEQLTLQQSECLWVWLLQKLPEDALQE